MAPNTKRWIDKKSSETYQLRYRSQADPLIHDSTAPDFVFTPVAAPNTNTKIKNATQLSTELAASGAAPPRKNEGEAAMYGIYYDDSAYDYMQHLREPGAAEAVIIDAKAPKAKGKTDLAAALAAAAPEEKEPKRLIPKELMASEVQLQRTWRDQQDVQDEIRGFRPDMDPRLREVLEALEDEAYVDDDEDIFGELAEGGEATPDEFYDEGDFWDEEEEEDGGWESDATEKPGEHQKAKAIEESAAGEKKAEVKETDRKKEEEEGDAPAATAAPAADNNAWMSEFSKFKKAEKRNKKMAGADDASSMADTMSFGGTSSFGGTMSMSGRTRRRHRKAGTESSGYSMTSSSLFRTEGLTTLDARFDKIEEEYADDSEEEDDAPAAPVPETRQDFNSIMDEFLEGYNVVGRNNPRVRKGKTLTGLEQLDEIRKGLGKARITEKPAKRSSRVR
ncbi:Low temperature viability protein [Morchella conica CCBAS932]|uniref:Low temperature viability protein n=1 Tax=Morchella conica CCBAS932 TaxID=1392247 RepID=A0A3N4KAR7_9PEZI|nr:Low temperature viability protein [Morchella conica CCBAS932]